MWPWIIKLLPAITPQDIRLTLFQYHCMPPEQFYELDEMEQAGVILEGRHIADRQDKEHHILLYKIDDLFVEVYYHKEYNVVRKFRAFTGNELSDIYLPKN